MNVPNRIRTPSAILILSWLLASCSILDPEDPEVIRVINNTSSSIYVQAWELESSYLVDPVPSFPFDPSEHSAILPGESQRFLPEEIDGPWEPGLGVALFIFEIEETTAVLKTLRQVPARELRNREGRIRISEF